MFILLLILAGCQSSGAGLVLAPGWQYHSLGAWKQLTPAQMALAPDGRWLYFASQLSEYTSLAAVVALNVKHGRTHVLVEGLRDVLSVRFAPDGSLWVAEGGDGMIWRMAEPVHFPDDQRVNPVTRESSYPGLAQFRFAGLFAHKAIAFSADHHFAYLADSASGGSLYRLDIAARKLAVWHKDKGWLAVIPEEAVGMASRLGAASFASISDIERMQDGTLLLAESGSGKILQLDDRGEQPKLTTWLQHDELKHPLDLSWDASRHWLWVTDDASPSVLWAWDGQQLHEVVHHNHARISAVLAVQDQVYVNLQRGPNNPAMTFILQEHHTNGL